MNTCFLDQSVKYQHSYQSEIMYRPGKCLQIAQSVCMTPKNLQVVSFDAEWKEIYLGTIRRDNFHAVCPNEVPGAASKVDVQYDRENAVITAAKWCPMANSTVLVLGSQFGVKLFDWDGSTQIYDYDFSENGIGVDDRLVAGGMVRGIAAIGPNYISVGIHTGTLILFEINTDADSFTCRVVDSQRTHHHPITDLASTTSSGDKIKDVLVSGDEAGLINIWALGEEKCLVHRKKVDSHTDSAITTLALWNKVGNGIIVAGYGSGLIRIFTIPSGDIMAEVCAHVGWITGMDLASHSGLLVTSSEDGFVRVFKLSTTGKVIQHSYSAAIVDSLPTGVKFLDPKGTSFALASYDSNKIQLYSM